MARVFRNKAVFAAVALLLTTSVASAQECPWWDYSCVITITEPPPTEPLPPEAYSDDTRASVDIGVYKEEGCTVIAENPPTISYKDANGAWVTATPKCVDSVPIALADGTLKEPIDYPELEDYKGDHYTKPECVTAPSDSPTLKEAQFTLTQCPANTFCAGGECKPPQKVDGCWDSDHVGLSDPKAFMVEFLQLNAQVKTPGFVKYPNPYFNEMLAEDAKTNPKYKFMPDDCKTSQHLYEQSCVTASNEWYFSESKQTLVACPTGTECKVVAITPTQDIKNDAAKDMSQPLKAARCMPLPDACPPPSIDVCPSIPGCQFTKLECPPDPDVCKNISKADLQKKYPASTIFQANSGGWHVDQCASPKQVYHLFCINGKSDDATTFCPPDTTCANGLCNGQPAPEPQDKPSDCIDTDVPANNPHGDLKVTGQIILKGTPTSIDSCQSKKIVKQDKCDATKAEGFSSKSYTCASKDDCCNGACFTPVAPKCDDYTNSVSGKHGVKGSNKIGDPFDAPDTCAGELLAKAACDLTGCIGYQFMTEACPDGKVCQDGFCIKKPVPCAASCTSLADGVEYIDTTDPLCPKKTYKNTCDGEFLMTHTCEDSKPVSTLTKCTSGLCDVNKCVDCLEVSDIENDLKVKGEVKSTTGNNLDFCTKEGKVMQVQCLDGKYNELGPADCPPTDYCLQGVCTLKPPQCKSDADCTDANLCTEEACVSGKCETISVKPTSKTACEQFSCDPQTGQTISTPINECVPPLVCDATKKCVLPDPCAGVFVDDWNACTTDKCVDGKVVNTPIPVDDGNLCTIDSCVGGEVKNTPMPVDDGDPCTVDSCSNGTISHLPSTDTLCLDKDNDGLPNDKDNCPTVYNKGQEDLNANKIGDACELQLTARNVHACATFIKQSDGSILGAPLLKCWGYNTAGQVGNGVFSPFVAPAATVIDSYGKPVFATHVSAGYNHTCALTTNNPQHPKRPFCWGNGALYANGNQWNLAKATAITNTLGVAGHLGVATGTNNSCAVTDDGYVYCWGGNILDQQKGSLIITLFPQYVMVSATEYLNNVTAITAGDSLFCAVKKDGTGWCWGKSEHGAAGNLADNSLFLVNYPKPVLSPAKAGGDPTATSPLTNILKLATSGYHSCAILKDTTVACWGRGVEGQLGIDKAKLAPGSDKQLFGYPNPVLTNPSESTSPLLTGVVDIALGEKHTCAVLQGGTVTCWGFNYKGQLGGSPIGGDFGPLTPVAVEGVSGVTQIAAGFDFTCARVKDQSVKCWGDNQYGQLGIPPPPKCGNNQVETGEECDDGNTLSNDGCSSTCKKDNVLQPSTPTSDCGNQVLELNEECDDGNTSNNDGCSSLCKKEVTTNPYGNP